MHKIVIADRVEDEVVDELKSHFKNVLVLPANMEKEMADADALVVRSMFRVSKAVLDGAKRLRVVARAGIGLDNIDAKECERRGIKVLNTPEASVVSVAELAIGLMLCLLRRITKADAQIRAKVWDRGALMGGELEGRTLGIIGFGRIGRAVAARAKAFGMHVVAYDPYVKSADVRLVPLQQLLAEADIVTIHTALTAESSGMLGRRELAQMKNGALLINTARGAVIDEDALYEALSSGKLAGAALDVLPREPYDGKLLSLESIVFSSHVGANTYEAQRRIGKEITRKIREALGA
jgi:D-3-phosphoglycerate dehydrogenase